MTMTQAELNEIFEKHKKWLNGEPGGERAILRDCDLSDCDLSGSDLSGCNLSNSKLRNSDLRYSDISAARLSDCDLSGSDLDYSCLPLWCGSLYAHFDDRQIVQIVYHAVKAGLASPNVSDEVKAELRKVIPLANRFHRVKECGVIKE